MRIHQKQSPAPRALTETGVSGGPKGKSVEVDVEWQHDFLREKVNMAVVLFFHAACSLRFIGLRVIRCLTRVCVCVIMGIVWINVCNWLSTCCLIVTSWGMLFYECDLLGGLVGIMKQYLKNETCLFHLVFCHLMSPPTTLYCSPGQDDEKGIRNDVGR